MPNVTFTSPETAVTVPAGTTVMDAARKAGIDLESPCNQTGVCGKCRVRVAPETLDRLKIPEEFILAPAAAQAGWILACQAEIHGDVEISLPRDKQWDKKKDGAASVLDHGICEAAGLAPAMEKTYDSGRDITLIRHNGRDISEEAGDTREGLFGLAVDIGTTTLVASLVDLTTGKETGSVSALNPQAKYAQDVLSRINFSKTAEGLATMQTAFTDCLNRLTAELCKKTAIPADRIYEAVFSGNTCMLHLAAGVSPASLGRFPYTPEIRGHLDLAAADLGLDLAPAARVYLPPVISAYVGADLTSGILGLMLHERPGITLLVDIGTNGEIILADNGKLTATSTAAGPALEGMNISCGMCAGPGAVERVSLSESGEVSFSAIDDEAAAGLCGSGLVDLVAALVDRGVIEPSGRYAKSAANGTPPDLLARVDGDGPNRRFNLAPEVFLTQRDIRQVQLAKGAIQAGITFLLKESGISPEQVDQVLIAGAFGFHLSTEGLISLKLLPEVFRDRVTYVGNTSKTGAQAFLANAPFRDTMDALVREVAVVELSGHPEFEQTFVRCLGF